MTFMLSFFEELYPEIVFHLRNLCTGLLLHVVRAAVCDSQYGLWLVDLSAVGSSWLVDVCSCRRWCVSSNQPIVCCWPVLRYRIIFTSCGLCSTFSCQTSSTQPMYVSCSVFCSLVISSLIWKRWLDCQNIIDIIQVFVMGCVCRSWIMKLLVLTSNET